MKRNLTLSLIILLAIPALSFARDGDEKDNEGGAQGTTSKSLSGGTDLKIQSSARPGGLNILGKVKEKATDDASKDFQVNTLPKLQQLANLNLNEAKGLSNTTVGLHKIDPAKLTLNTKTEVRAYFVNEGAGYHNSLGFFPSKDGVVNGSKSLIFPDASTNADLLNPKATATRSSSAPLLPGDFVNMGKFDAGTLLNFFLIADGANGGKNVWSTQQKANADGLIHAVAYTLPGTPYLLIGFEDLYGGGDKDYNDILFTLDIGKGNVEHLSGPEPSTMCILGGLLTLGVAKRRRRPALRIA